MATVIATTLAPIQNNRERSTMNNSNRVSMREQSLPSYLQAKSGVVDVEVKISEFAPVNAIVPKFLHFEVREKKNGL
jgi:hypothetical protein